MTDKIFLGTKKLKILQQIFFAAFQTFLRRMIWLRASLYMTLTFRANVLSKIALQ